MTTVDINLISAGLLSAKKGTAHRVLEALCIHAPQLIPDVYGHWEPLRNRFEPDAIDTVLDGWRDTYSPLLWKRKNPASEGSIGATTPSEGHSARYSIVAVSGDASRLDLARVVDLFIAWCSILKPAFGCVQLLTEGEIHRGRNADVVVPIAPERGRYHFYITNHTLAQYLPDLYWTTVFGHPYLAHFGRSQLLSSPAFIVREIDGDMVCLQLSSDLMDMADQPAEVERVRRAVKEHLGVESFFDPSLGKEYRYSTPFPKVSESTSQGRSADGECIALVDALVPLAKKTLQRFGEFYPYGGAITSDGRIEHMAACAGTEHPSSHGLIDLLVKEFRDKAAKGHIRACAIVCNVSVVRPGGKRKIDAIQVSFDHVDGLSVRVNIPYRLQAGHEPEFGAESREPGQGLIFMR